MQNEIILTLNSIMASSDILTKIVPILSDIFVFTYPVYLVYLYFFSHDTISRGRKLWNNNTDRLHKYNALTLLSSFIGSIIVNYAIKAFIEQPRPYLVLNLMINPEESMILQSIPADSFPSDHAAVSMTIAVATLIIGYRDNNKKIITIGRSFLGFALIMGISRVTIGVHRPIDIIAGSIIGAGIAYLITYTTVTKYLSDKIYNPLIDFQEYLFGLIKK